MNTKLSAFLLAAAGLSATQSPVDACTGITLKSKEGTTVTARTIEWAETVMNTFYVVVPLGLATVVGVLLTGTTLDAVCC